jgi:hypothetical protein
MKPFAHMNIARVWMKSAKYAVPCLIVVAVLLVAFGYYVNEPVYGLKVFFGLQADD